MCATRSSPRSCQLLDVASRTPIRSCGSPRANGEEIGALVGAGGPVARVDPVQLDTAAVPQPTSPRRSTPRRTATGARERHDRPADGVLNRRGLEERLERELASAKERRAPMSLLVIDCDDLKEINDRAGHEFGDALLREVAGVPRGRFPRVRRQAASAATSSS